MWDGSPRGYLKTGRRLDDPATLSRMVGADSPEQVARLLVELETACVFSRDDEGTIFSRRMVREAHVSEVRSAAGAIGGQVAQAKVRANSEQTAAVAVAVADAEKEKPESASDAFERLWKVCAKKVSKGQAERTFEKLYKAGILPPTDDLITHLEARQRAEDWTKEGRRYQLHLSTWLNAKGWLDEPPATTSRRSMGTDPEREFAIANLGKDRTINMDEIQ
jgi:hypothetical protein